MPLKTGEWVRLMKLRREGRVAEVLRGGLYKVSVGGLLVQCREEELVFLPDGPEDEEIDLGRKAKASSRAKAKVGTANAPSVDLHGMRVEEAMKVVEDRVNGAILSGADALRVVHGKGSGKIQAALHRYLRGLAVVKRFRVDEKNAGVTWVYF